MKTTERAERRIERPRVERVGSSTAPRPWVIASVVAALALVVGLGVGFLLGGSDDPASTDLVAVDGAELTDRQEQMEAIVDEYVAAWQEGDGDTLAAMFTDDGSLEVFGTEYPVEGGALAGYVDTHRTPTLETLEPVLIDDNRMLMFHRGVGMGTLTDVIDFTSTGEVLIVSHEIMN